MNNQELEQLLINGRGRVAVAQDVVVFKPAMDNLYPDMDTCEVVRTIGQDLANCGDVLLDAVNNSRRCPFGSKTIIERLEGMQARIASAITVLREGRE